jgi:hypothetical protein
LVVEPSPVIELVEITLTPVIELSPVIELPPVIEPVEINLPPVGELPLVIERVEITWRGIRPASQQVVLHAGHERVDLVHAVTADRGREAHVSEVVSSEWPSGWQRRVGAVVVHVDHGVVPPCGQDGDYADDHH